MVPLEVESWIWWSVVIVVAGSRFIARRMTLGAFRRYQIDEYMMTVVLCFYTSLIATINIVRHTSSNLLPPGYDVNDLTKADIREREYGSKLILVVEQCQCVTIWGAKLCVIALYNRLTTLRKENIAIKALAVYVVGSFIIMDILYFGVWCQPFHDYWAVPTPNRQCDAATHHLITNAVFNLSSDCILLAIGLPMFLRMHLPLQKKIPLVGVFSLGLFVILAAVLNKVYSFTRPFGSLWTYWYVRESSTALLVANLPFVWTLWRRMAGLKTVVGVSRSGSISKGDPASHSTTSGPEMSATEAKVVTNGWFTQDSDDDFDLKNASQKPPAGLTLEEILKDENPAAMTLGDQEPNLYTHPQLFFSRNASAAAKTSKDTAAAIKSPEPHIQKAVLHDTPEHAIVRRDSDRTSFHRERTPASPSVPSFVNGKSADDMV